MADELSSVDQANLLAGQAVAYATAFLDGRNDAEQLLVNASQLQGDLRGQRDKATNAIIDPARVLVIAMLHTARAEGDARQDRWRDVMASLVQLVRSESLALRSRADGSTMPCDESGFSAGFECPPLPGKDDRA